MVENFAKWPSERGQTAKVRSSEGCEGMEFPWRWISGTIFSNLDVIWGMSAKWAPAGEFLVVLALVGLSKRLERVLRSVLVASGRPHNLFIAAIETAVSIPIFWAAGRYLDIWGIIAAYLFVSAIAFPLIGYFVQRHLDDTWLIARAIWRSLIAGAVMFGIVILVPQVFDFTKISAVGIQVIVGIGLYSIIRWLVLTSTEREIVRTWPVLGRILG